MKQNKKTESTPTRAEERASSAIQATAALISVAGLLVMINLALPHGAMPVTSVSIYGGTLIFAFLASALYHGIKQVQVKQIFRTIDHCAILLLIAGTYTPVAMIVLENHAGWLLMVAVWGIAGLGVFLRVFLPHIFLKMRVALYLSMGWLIVAWASPVIEGIGAWGAGLFLAGGLAYSSGLGFYAWNKLPYNHAVWHLFVFTGSSCFFAATTLYVLPGLV